MSRDIQHGSTDESTVVRIVDSTTGLPEEAVEHDTSGLALWYRREGGLRITITPVALAALNSAHSDGGIEHIDDGYYRLDVADAAFASGATGVAIGGTATGMVIIAAYHPLVAFNPQDAVRMGLSALPNASPAADGGLPTVDGTNHVAGLQGTSNHTLDDIADADGKVTLAPVTHTGATIPTVTSVAGLTTAAIKSIWDQATSALTTAGSIGKFIIDNINTLLTRLSAVRAGYLDKLNITGNVAASGEVTAIQNNTRVRVVVPEAIERPDSGSTAYKLHLYIYDTEGNMEAPDSTPTIAAENEAGTDRSGNLGTVTLEDTGHYSVTYTVASGHAIEQVLFEWSVVENSVTRLHGTVAQVVDTTAVDYTAADRTRDDAIAAKTVNLPASPAAVGSEMNLADDAITAAKITTAAITADKIATNAIAAAKIATGALTAAKFGDAAIGASTLAAGAITADKIAADAITAAKFDKTTAFPLESADTGDTQVARTGADGDTLEDLSDQLDAVSGEESRAHTGTAQGGTANTITLAAGASSQDNIYKHGICYIHTGTGAGEFQISDSYVGSTKVLTMAANWVITPDNTSQYRVLPLGTIPGASAPTAAQVADAVLTELLADHKDTEGSLAAVANEIHCATAPKKIVANKSNTQSKIYDRDGTTLLFTEEVSKDSDDEVKVTRV